MPMTLDALWTLHGSTGSPGFAEVVNFVARGGSRRSHFVFFGSGGGSALLLVPIVLIATVGGYLMRNPDKARGLKERLNLAWKAGSSTLDSYRYPTPPGPNWPPPSYPPGSYPPPNQTACQHNMPPRTGMRFNSPPGWPAPPAGWAPSSDWEPDPSWPAAPPGWPFWVPEHQPPQRST
jgi:hypothetical protein